MKIEDIIKSQIYLLRTHLDKNELAFGEVIYNNGACQILSQSPLKYELVLCKDETNQVFDYALDIDDEGGVLPVSENGNEWDRNSFACLLQVESELHLLDKQENAEHKKYSYEGMKKRVLQERRLKANKAEYKIEWANNIYGDHTVINENGVKYTVFLRNFEEETGYSNSMDSKLNKLGTTKHIMFAFEKLKENKRLYNRLSKTFPFVEIFCDPLNENRISWYYPTQLPLNEQLIISRYFKKAQFIKDKDVKLFLSFIAEAENHQLVKIRPEVRKVLEAAFEKDMLIQLKNISKPNFSLINANLYDYQKEGIEFVLFKSVAIIADEMGLGKTIQAIGTAVLKKQLFDFKKTLIVCPASIKEQWKNEIEKFSHEKAIVVQGKPDERAELYKSDQHYFFIVNYETVLRDQVALNNAGIDFLVLDEAQRAKNYETKTANSLKRIDAKHKLVITGTPIENKLIDIFSIMGILNPYFLGPLWEFSYKHCLFDPVKQNKITGYYNLQELNTKLDQILIRREKRKVLNQLPQIQQTDIYLKLSPLQADYHASYGKALAKLIHKKFLTPYDMQRIMLLLTNMRMVCNSSYLIDEETNESPKLDELKYMLLEKLDIKNSNHKIIIFSEWIKVHKLMGEMLRENNIGFVELNGKIPVKSRGALIRKFEENENYKVFLSTEAGGSGLNLQMADILINFELPWNPAKKNQRIGRIDRIGQKSKKLSIYNFITLNSIEMQISGGLLIKQSLFDGVLGGDANQDFVDFSSKGRSQFIQQLEEFIVESENDDFETYKKSAELKTTEAIKESQTEMDILNEDDELLIEQDIEETHLKDEEQQQTSSTPGKGETKSQAKELEQVMNYGMQFLSGMFKMSTGKDMGIENQTIDVNEETGEVIMKFKLPTK